MTRQTFSTTDVNKIIKIKLNYLFLFGVGTSHVKRDRKKNKKKDFPKKRMERDSTKRLIPPRLLELSSLSAHLPKPGRGLAEPFTSETGRVHCFWERKSKSLWVTRPINFAPIFPVSVMGMPEYPCFSLMALTSDTRAVGGKTKGSIMKPCSYF